jgi:hypothetical protein
MAVEQSRRLWRGALVANYETDVRSLNDRGHFSVISDRIFDEKFFRFCVLPNAAHSKNENIGALQLGEGSFGDLSLLSGGFCGSLCGVGALLRDSHLIMETIEVGASIQKCLRRLFFNMSKLFFASDPQFVGGFLERKSEIAHCDGSERGDQHAP